MDGGKDLPGTPRVLDQLQRFGDTRLVSPFQNILRNIPLSERISTTSPSMNPTSLNTVILETVTPSLDDYEEVVFVADNASVSVSLTPPRTDIQDNNDMPPTPDPPLLLLPPSCISPPATITTNTSKQPIVSGTSLDTLSVTSRVSRDPKGNRPTINQPIIAVAAATPSTHSREPAGSIAGSIERQVERQNQQLDAVIQGICPSRPDPLIATETSSMILSMTNPTMQPTSPSLQSFPSFFGPYVSH